MERLTDTLKLLGGMPFEVLLAVVVLSAFGLAAYAIAAVVAVTKEHRK